jgi:hypothetical protein
MLSKPGQPREERLRAQGSGLRAQGSELRAQSTEHRAQSTEHRAQSTEHRVICKEPGQRYYKNALHGISDPKDRTSNRGNRRDFKRLLYKKAKFDNLISKFLI